MEHQIKKKDEILRLLNPEIPVKQGAKMKLTFDRVDSTLHNLKINDNFKSNDRRQLKDASLVL